MRENATALDDRSATAIGRSRLHAGRGKVVDALTGWPAEPGRGARPCRDASTATPSAVYPWTGQPLFQELKRKNALWVYVAGLSARQQLGQMLRRLARPLGRRSGPRCPNSRNWTRPGPNSWRPPKDQPLRISTPSPGQADPGRKTPRRSETSHPHFSSSPHPVHRPLSSGPPTAARTQGRGRTLRDPGLPGEIHRSMPIHRGLFGGYDTGESLASA